MFQSHTYLPPSPALHLVLWPCGGGDALQYPLPKALLDERGVALTRFNPGGHGASDGPFSFEATIDGLNRHLSRFPDVPRAAIGHSMGTFGVLRAADALNFQFISGVAPIPSSRRSVEWMAENGHLDDFIRLFPVPSEHRERVTAILQDLRWLDRDWFETVRADLDVPCLDHFRIPSLAGFLNEVFMPGYSIWPLASSRRQSVRLYGATEDTFFPQHELRADAARHDVPFEVFDRASDHLFRRAWPAMMEHIITSHPLLPASANSIDSPSGD